MTVHDENLNVETLHATGSPARAAVARDGVLASQRRSSTASRDLRNATSLPVIPVMRFKSCLPIFFVVTLMSSSSAPAQAVAAVTTPASVPSKIAFVNLQEAVISCNEGKQEAAALQQKFAGRQSALKAQDDEVKFLKQEYQAVSANLSEEERNARTRSIQEKQKAFERSYADYQAETQEAQQEALNRVFKKLLPVVEKYAAANGYTAVFDVSNPQTPVVWLRKDAMITKQVVEAYNAETTAAPPSVAPPAPAPTADTTTATAPPEPTPTPAAAPSAAPPAPATDQPSTPPPSAPPPSNPPATPL